MKQLGMMDKMVNTTMMHSRSSMKTKSLELISLTVNHKMRTKIDLMKGNEVKTFDDYDIK